MSHPYNVQPHKNGIVDFLGVALMVAGFCLFFYLAHPLMLSAIDQQDNFSREQAARITSHGE